MIDGWVGRPLALRQVQGLMEVFGRGWCNIYLWTPNGSAMFHVTRDAAYWGACFEVLSDFWWAHLVPAKHALAVGKRALAEEYRCCCRLPPFLSSFCLLPCWKGTAALHVPPCAAIAIAYPHAMVSTEHGPC
jgi:hypothetical protein